MKVMVWVGMVAAVLSAIWVLFLSLYGVRLNPDFCHYFVPVKQHPGVYTCSAHLKPAKP